MILVHIEHDAAQGAGIVVGDAERAAVFMAEHLTNIQPQSKMNLRFFTFTNKRFDAVFEDVVAESWTVVLHADHQPLRLVTHEDVDVAGITQAVCDDVVEDGVKDVGVELQGGGVRLNMTGDGFGGAGC